MGPFRFLHRPKYPTENAYCGPQGNGGPGAPTYGSEREATASDGNATPRSNGVVETAFDATQANRDFEEAAAMLSKKTLAAVAAASILSNYTSRDADDGVSRVGDFGLPIQADDGTGGLFDC